MGSADDAVPGVLPFPYSQPCRNTIWPVDHPTFEGRAARERTRRIASGLVVATAALGLLSALTPPLRGRLHDLVELMPVEVPQVASSSLVFGSLALALVARGLRRGARIAWVATLVLLVVSAGLHVVKGADIEEAVVDLLVAGWLIFQRRSFPLRPDAHTLRRSAAVAATGTVVAVAASSILVALVGARRRPGFESLRALTDRLAGNRAVPLPAASPIVNPALAAVGLGLLTIVGWRLLGPRRPVRATVAEHRADREHARTIVAHHGGDTLAYFALRDDKEWFFSGSSVVAYGIRNGVCLVAPDPIGPPEEWAEVWADFSTFADEHGWSIAVVGAQPDWLPVYEAAGMTPVYMGDEAIIDCTTFSIGGGTMKSIRGAYNRVKKHGYRTRFFDPAQLEPKLVGELREVMTETRRGDTERGFSMTLSRIFDPADTGLLLSVTFDPDDRVAAFCHWTPAADINGWSLDLMRRRDDPDMPNGVTDFLVIETIEHAAKTGASGIALNFAVLRAVVAGERDGGFFELQRRVLHRFSESMQIESLWRYNEKFRPHWRPRYVVLDAVEHATEHGLAIADAEGLSELPMIGRFLGRGAEVPVA